MRMLKIGSIFLLLFLALPRLSHGATFTPESVEQSATPAVAGTLICAGNYPAIPNGWLIVDFYYDPAYANICFPFGAWNVWIIDNLAPKAVGTVMLVCTDYNRILPPDWRFTGRYFQSSTQCGRSRFLTYYNITEIVRVTAPAPQFEGSFEGATCSNLQGWAWDRLRPNTPISVDILADGNLVTQLLADVPRPDLVAAGKGDGRHGFNLAVPTSLLDNVDHSISARATNSSFVLTFSPRSMRCPNPIDDPRFFVRQHYLDFLGREPDQGGWDFWTNKITVCGADAACLDLMRVETSKAFFLSIEFQVTGYVVHRFYRSSFARVPTNAEFTADKQSIIAAGAQAFANAWVQRPSFRSVYDPLFNWQYVDRLFANAQVAPDAAFRDSLVAGLDSGAYTRATVLRMIVDYQPFVNHEFNPAFVLMQYFGYLRRDPDPGGYAFWLGQLNQYNNQNDMVKAFITATEYRGRFGKP